MTSICRSSSTTLLANSFLLSLASPVLHKMLCSGFSESKERTLHIFDVDSIMFIKTLDVCCGRDCCCQELGLGEMHQPPEIATIIIIADQFQMTWVEEALIGVLSLDICMAVLVWCNMCGMQHLLSEALKLAVLQFDDFAATVGFMQMEEAVLGSVVDDDRLVSRSEEAVWEAVVEWMRGAARLAGVAGWRGVVSKVRFPLMGDEYLQSRVLGMVSSPGEETEWMAGIVDEALLAKKARKEGRGATFGFVLLGQKALVNRIGYGVRWEDYKDGGELRLGPSFGSVCAIAECEGWICSSSRGLGQFDMDSILVWSRATEDHCERTMRVVVNDIDHVHALVSYEGRLISGHDSGRLRVWDVATAANLSLWRATKMLYLLYL